MLFNGHELIVKRGQHLTGRNILANETGVNSSSVHRRLTILKNVGFIDIKSNNKFSIITICNYNEYQVTDNKIEQQIEHQLNIKRTSSEQPANTPKELNKENKENKEKANDEPRRSMANGFKTTATGILLFLNEKVQRNYQPVKVNIDFIIHRLEEGATPKQCRQVIVRKARDWLNDPKMTQYLRPATLFNKTKFAQYVGELVSIPEEELT